MINVDNDLLCYLKDVHCSSIFIAHRAQNLSKTSSVAVLSTLSFHCAVKNEHFFQMFTFYVFFDPKNKDLFNTKVQDKFTSHTTSAVLAKSLEINSWTRHL